MVCRACSSSVGSPCAACRASLIDAPARALSSGLLVLPAYLHQDLARTLVHRLKYRADPGAAYLLGSPMAAKLPPWVEVLVPVPRARLRRWRYGIDPALELARAISRTSSLPVLSALVAPSWWPAHAAGSRTERQGPSFRATTPAPAGAILVDDVVTSGSTLLAACAALNDFPGAALVATTA